VADDRLGVALGTASGEGLMDETTAAYDPTCDYAGACCHYDQGPRCVADGQADDWISQWVAGIVQDVASVEDHEWVINHVCPYHVAMAYVLRCLANPGCAGSGDVLEAIVAKRQERLAAAAESGR
jgi:hypothetical protein